MGLSFGAFVLFSDTRRYGGADSVEHALPIPVARLTEQPCRWIPNTAFGFHQPAPIGRCVQQNPGWPAQGTGKMCNRRTGRDHQSIFVERL